MLIPNMKLLFLGSTDIVVETGSKTVSVVEIQLIICKFIVCKAMFMNNPTKTPTTKREHIPPEAVL